MLLDIGPGDEVILPSYTFSSIATSLVIFGGVPWRFSLLLDENSKRAIIKTLLDNNYPVSDWYPNVTELFLKKRVYLMGLMRWKR